MAASVRSLRVRCALGCALFLAAIPVARAGSTNSLDIERLVPAPDDSGGFATPSPGKQPLGQFALSLLLDDEVAPLVLRSPTGTVISNVIPNRLAGAVTGEVNFGAGFSLGVVFPVLLTQNGSTAALPSDMPASGQPLTASAIGDLRLVPRFTFLSEQKEGADLAIEGGVVFPTGSGSALFGQGTYSGIIDLVFGRTFGPVRLLAQAGVELRPQDNYGRIPLGDSMPLRIAGVFDLPKGMGAFHQIIGEIDSSVYLGPNAASTDDNPAEWRVGARFCAGNVMAFTVGVGSGLVNSYGTPAFRVLGGVGYDPRACGGTSESKPPSTSREPRETEPSHAPEQPSEIADRDGDGVPDDLDQCPDLPGDKANHGCPAPVDSDGDGIPDVLDKCPDQKGDAKHDGCPAPEDVTPAPAPGPIVITPLAGPLPGDRDADGVPDAVDKCPDVPGDKAHEGCPFHDRDGDNVPDELDNCPYEKGTAENFGCIGKQSVELADDRIIVLDRIRFDRNSSRFEGNSGAVVDQVAAVLRVHPEITKVRVEGHTDNHGSARSLAKLSRQWADAVVERLVQSGVAVSRLEAVGMSGEEPIASNRTQSGRESNRRIEFVILDRTQKVYIHPIIDEKGATKYLPGAAPQTKAPAPPPEPPPSETKPSETKPAPGGDADLAMPDDLQLPSDEPAQKKVTPPSAPPKQPAPKPAPAPAPPKGDLDLPPLDDLPPIQQ